MHAAFQRGDRLVIQAPEVLIEGASRQQCAVVYVDYAKDGRSSCENLGEGRLQSNLTHNNVSEILLGHGCVLNRACCPAFCAQLTLQASRAFAGQLMLELCDCQQTDGLQSTDRAVLLAACS